MEYTPDDAGLTVSVLTYLEQHDGLLRAAMDIPRPAPADIERLRRGHPAEMVRGALVVAEARRKAQEKFCGFAGFDPKGLWGTPEAVEQASGATVSRHKAAKVAEYVRAEGSSDPVWDFCSGIGGDTLGLAERCEVIAVELSPVRAWCLGRNTAKSGRVTVVCGRVTPALEVMRGGRECVFHIDPARRQAGVRLHRYADLIPGPKVIAALMGRFEAGLVKLSPAVDFASLPQGGLELISSDGVVVQAVLWVGALAGSQRVATVFKGVRKAVVVGTPIQGIPERVAPQQFVYEIDGAVHRAQLAGVLAEELGLSPITADGGYVTGDTVTAHLALACFRHHVTIRFDEKKLIETLKSVGGGEGTIEVKTRGGLGLETDSLQKRLTEGAPTGATVLVYRGESGIVASICRRNS